MGCPGNVPGSINNSNVGHFVGAGADRGSERIIINLDAEVGRERARQARQRRNVEGRQSTPMAILQLDRQKRRALTDQPRDHRRCNPHAASGKLLLCSTQRNGAIDCRGEGRISIAVLGSSNVIEHGAELRTLVTRPDPQNPSVFEEHGRISIDGMGSISIKTVSLGGDEPSVDPGWIHGYAVFRIASGDGAFAGASGYVKPTSRWIRMVECTTPKRS